MAELRPSRVERGLALTRVIYGGDPGRAYPLRPQDVQQVEEHVGKTLETMPEAELRSALAALGIPIRPPDPVEPPGQDLTPPRPAQPAVKPAPATGVPPVGKPAPPPPVPPRRNPWAILLPIISGGVVLLLLVVLLRSCGARPAQPTTTETPSPTARALTGTPIGATATAGGDTPTPTSSPTPSPTATATASATPSRTPTVAPVAAINGPTTGETGQRLRFDARRSTAAPGSSLTAFDWDFGDGIASSGIEVEHTYSRPGVYNLLLRVADSNGLQTEALQRVEIRPAPATPTPLPPRAVISAPPTANVNQPAIFDGRESTAPAPIVQYRWTFGDGGTEEGARVSHAYVTPGVFNVTLVIIDETGRESIAATQIEVRGEQPTPTATPSPLAGASWALTAYNNGAGGLASAIMGVTVTAAFGQGGDLAGFGGCNSYTGAYQAAEGAITIRPPAATTATCSEPPGVMEQEQAYFGLLPQASNYRSSGDRLELTGNDGAVLLQFTRLVQPR